MTLPTDVHTVILVEGDSDREAVEALAARRGRDLADEGVCVVTIGGATTIGRFVGEFGPHGLDVDLAGLVDAAEEGDFRRRLTRGGLGPIRSRDELEAAGFFVCVDDLEDELIRALGAARVMEVVAGQGELESFRVFQKQPAQRERSIERQLRRFLGTKSGRKVRYGRVLVEALDPDRVPAPLDRLLGHVRPASGAGS